MTCCHVTLFVSDNVGGTTGVKSWRERLGNSEHGGTLVGSPYVTGGWCFLPCGYISLPLPSKANFEELFMFYTLVNGNLSTVNCQPVSNSNISGFGVRYTHYLQALLSILLAFKYVAPYDTLVNNIASQVVSLSLVAAAYFDTNVDVLNSIIVSHFVVMFAACNFTALDFSAEVAQSRRAMKILPIMWVLDTLTWPIILVYTCGLWVMVRRLQRQVGSCPQGAGYWIFFGSIYQIKSANTASDIALAITVLEIVNHCIRVLAEITRQWFFRKERARAGQGHPAFDARIWWLWKLHRTKSGSETVVWNGNKISLWTRRFSQTYRTITFIYIFATVEITILANPLSPAESRQGWTFAQVLAIINTFVIFSICCLRYKILSELIRTVPSFHFNLLL